MIRNLKLWVMALSALLITIESHAATYKGTITIEVGEKYSVDIGFAYSTVSGYWSKSNSTFGFSSQGQRSCTIYGINAGTGTLTWKGLVNADWFEYYWNVEVVAAPTPENKIAIDATNFPDANFRSYLLEQSYGKDGVITESEIKDIKYIDVSKKQISSLKGIEYFTTLTRLYCNDNQLTSLDVSKNTALNQLYCHESNLIYLDVSMNTALNTLYCYRNKISGANMDNLISGLPQQETAKLYVLDYTKGDEGNVCTVSQVAAARAKGWTPMYCSATGTTWEEYEGSEESSSVKGVVNDDSQANGTAPIYNLRGQHLTTPQKGINIIDGKKVVMK